MIYVQCACSTYLLSLLSSLQVTWLKREQNNSHIQLLTIGVHTYTFDKRFSVEFEYPNNWRLRIADTNKSDEGLYVKTSIPLENCASQSSVCNSLQFFCSFSFATGMSNINTSTTCHSNTILCQM